MYHILLSMHAWCRWLVLISLLYSIYMAYQGTTMRKVFTAHANAIRHWTATIAHIQLLIGMTLYFKSPLVLLRMPSATGVIIEHVFFRYVHIALMILAVVLITVGSAKAKRMPNDGAKYKTMLRWFVIALLVIVIAIPWPFSPFAARPYLRSF